MLNKPLAEWSALEMSQELRKMSPSEQVDYLQRWVDAKALIRSQEDYPERGWNRANLLERRITIAEAALHGDFDNV